MAIHNFAQVTQCFIYLVAAIFSLTFFIPMAMNVSEFQGKCLLFTTGIFNESDGRIFEPNWSSFSYCGLTLFTGSFVFFMSSCQLYCMAKFILKGLTGSFITTFWDATIAFIAVVLTLINSILVNIGFNQWCVALSQNFESCGDAADSNVMIIANTTIKPDKFYLEMGTVIFGSYVTLIAWVLILVITGLTIFQYHERENLIISMARERKRYDVIDE